MSETNLLNNKSDPKKILKINPDLNKLGSNLRNEDELPEINSVSKALQWLANEILKQNKKNKEKSYLTNLAHDVNETLSETPSKKVFSQRAIDVLQDANYFVIANLLKSFINLWQRRKIRKALLITSATFIGLGVGAVLGTLVFPGIGTVVGATLGGIINAGVAAMGGTFGLSVLGATIGTYLGRKLSKSQWFKNKYYQLKKMNFSVLQQHFHLNKTQVTAINAYVLNRIDCLKSPLHKKMLKQLRKDALNGNDPKSTKILISYLTKELKFLTKDKKYLSDLSYRMDTVILADSLMSLTTAPGASANHGEINSVLNKLHQQIFNEITKDGFITQSSPEAIKFISAYLGQQLEKLTQAHPNNPTTTPAINKTKLVKSLQVLSDSNKMSSAEKTALKQWLAPYAKNTATPKQAVNKNNLKYHKNNNGSSKKSLKTLRFNQPKHSIPKQPMTQQSPAILMQSKSPVTATEIAQVHDLYTQELAKTLPAIKAIHCDGDQYHKEQHLFQFAMHENHPPYPPLVCQKLVIDQQAWNKIFVPTENQPAKFEQSQQVMVAFAKAYSQYSNDKRVFSQDSMSQELSHALEKAGLVVQTFSPDLSLVQSIPKK
jgi:hypothetical protein